MKLLVLVLVLAFGTTAPVGSEIFPMIWPVSVCASAAAESRVKANRAAKTRAAPATHTLLRFNICTLSITPRLRPSRVEAA